MLPFYKVELVGMEGQTLREIEEVTSVQAARAFNGEGSCTVVISDTYDRSLFPMHARMKLWRFDYSGVPYNFGDTLWFLKKVDHDLSEGTLTLSFVDTIAMIKTRLVAYTSEGTYADKTLDEYDVATYNDIFRLDNLMRAYMRENWTGDALDGARVVPQVMVEDDRSLAPYGEKQAAWQDLLAVMTDLASQSAAKGTPLYFDLVPGDLGTFLFRAYTTLPGKDRRSGTSMPLILTEDSGMLGDVHQIDDYSNVATYCYALGAGSGGSQLIMEAGNPILYRGDPFNRIEMTVNASDTSEPTVLMDTARSALMGRRPRRLVTARVVENSALSYGRDLRYGDGLVVQVGGANYDCLIDAISTRWAEGEEQLEIRLQGELAYVDVPLPEGDGATPNPYPVPPPEGPQPFDGGLLTTTQLVAGIGSMGEVCRTSDFQSVTPTWDAVYFTHGELVDPELLQCFVVDPFSPGYLNTADGPINGWAVNLDGIWRLEDLFGATPTAALAHAFAPTDAMYQGTYAIAASFGAFFEADNPWIVVVAMVNRAGGTLDPDDGVWAIHSEDAGATWSSEIRVTPIQNAGTSYQTTQRPTVWTSPRTPGYGLTFAYTAAGLVEAYATEDWGATWSRFGGVIADDPLFPLPLWAVYDDASSTTLSTTVGASFEYTVGASGGTIETVDHFVLLAMPANAKRVVLSCYVKHVTTTTSEIHTNTSALHSTSITAGVTQVEDLTFVAAPDAGGTVEYYYTVEFTRTHPTNDWPGNRETAEVTPPTNEADYCRFEMFVNAQGISGEIATSTLTFKVEVTEIEMEDTTIFVPGFNQRLWSGLGFGGGIHVPWQDNVAESIIYFGRLIPGTINEFTLHRFNGSTITDITPVEAEGGYGPYRGLFGIRAHDSDRTRLLFAGKTEGVDGWHYFSVFTSADGGDTWTQVQGPDREDEFSNWMGWEAAFAADDLATFYIWGGSQTDAADGATTYGTVIGYSDDFGATIQDKTGNLITLEASDENLAGFIGIAGGPTV